jgi:undecaprenyl-diphosphatase
MFKNLTQLDYKVFYYLNHLGDISSLDILFVIMAVYFAYVMVVLVAAFWFVKKDRLIARKVVILSAISGILAREVFANIIRTLYHRHRPYLTYHIHELISKGNDEASFPSGHATAMFAVASVIYFYNKKLGGFLYALSILTGISRVIVGVHYPSDIIAGAALGILTGYLVYKLLDKPIQNFAATWSTISDRLLPFTKAK